MIKVTSQRGKSRTSAIDLAPWWCSIVTNGGFCGLVWCYQNRQGQAGNNPPKDFLQKTFAAHESIAALQQAIQREFPNARPVKSTMKSQQPEWLAMLIQFFKDYYNEKSKALSRPVRVWTDWSSRLDTTGLSPFAMSVLEQTAAIPAGQTRSYGEIAADLGRPRAARAVGTALRRNPFPVLIPCHRVIGKSGDLTGFSAPGGIAAKQRMLQRERCSNV